MQRSRLSGMFEVVSAFRFRRRVLFAPILTIVGLLGAATSAGAPIPIEPGPSRQQAAAEPTLLLKDSLPQEAFATLGQRYGAEFRLVEDQQWIDATAGVRVNADLRELTFWNSILTLADQTGYEPVFRPYGRSEQGRPVIWLRRVDVRAEQALTPSVAAGPLLLRATEAQVTIDLRMSQIRMAPPQAGVRVEVFLEPGVSAVYVTAAALRAFDETGVAMRRGEGHDPTVGMERDGVGEMTLYFDAVRRIPVDVARWQALMRVVESKRAETLLAPVTAIPEVRRHGVVARPATRGAGGDPSPRITTAPAPQPATLPSAVHELGPYRLALEPVRVGERQMAEDSSDAPPRIATVQLVVPRASLDHTAWSRLYGFLVSCPPELLQSNSPDEVGLWRMTGYAVVSAPSADEPDVAGSFRVWAQYEAAAGSPDPKWLRWTLPVESEEQRVPATWDRPLTIKPPPERPQTRPAKVPRAPAGAGE